MRRRRVTVRGMDCLTTLSLPMPRRPTAGRLIKIPSLLMPISIVPWPKKWWSQEVDRPPFTFYHHYKRPTAPQEADDHLAFHRAYNTDIVKVMNDFDYPKSTTEKWYQLKPVDSPYPGQLATLKRVRDGLNGDAYFIDTIYGPYMTAMILYQAQARFANLPKSTRPKTSRSKACTSSSSRIPRDGTRRWKPLHSPPSITFDMPERSGRRAHS